MYEAKCNPAAFVLIQDSVSRSEEEEVGVKKMDGICRRCDSIRNVLKLHLSLKLRILRIVVHKTKMASQGNNYDGLRPEDGLRASRNSMTTQRCLIDCCGIAHRR